MMRGTRLTDAQRRALDLDRHTAVSAGAGSGKTFVLTERFVSALERVRHQPRPLRRVVAITFSRKATAEMRARVRAAVATRLKDAARAGDAELVRFWRTIRDQLHTARIATIDAFCASLLRDHPLASAVDPGFEVVEAAEARLIARDAVGAALTHVSKHAPPEDDALEALGRLTGRYRRYEIVEMLSALLADRALGAAWSAEIGSERSIDARFASTREALDTRFRLGLDRIGRRIDETTRRAMARAAAQSGDDALMPAVRAADALLRAISAGTVDDATFLAAAKTLLREKRDTGNWSARSFGGRGRARVWGGADAVAAVREHAGTVARTLAEELWWYAPFDAALEREGLVAERDLAMLYRHVERRYRSLLGVPRRLDFAGLTLAAGELVTREAAAARIAAEIDHLLVDEFQDTSIAQWTVLERIVRASAPASSPDAPPRITVFVVGDEKQAIYEFRGGRVEVFRRVMSRLAEWGGQLVVMDDNFRSLPNPISVVNDVFAEVFLDRDERAFEAAPQPLRPHRASPDGTPSNSGVVELLLSDPGAAKDVDTLRELEADRIAAHVRSLVDEGTTIVDPETNTPRPAVWSDVAVIVFYKRLYANLENAFAAHGVPTRVLGGLGFYQSREVLDATAFLRALTDRRDEIALAALLRSPFGNVSDPLLWKLARHAGADLGEKLDAAVGATDASAPRLDATGRSALGTISGHLASWRARLGRVPTGSLLDDAMRTTGYLAAAGALPGGERRVATIEKLLDVIRRFEARHGIRPVELCEWLVLQSAEVHDEGEGAESGRADGVTLMTIHRAKGTEYPIVVVPGLLDPGQSGDALPFRRTHDVDGARMGLKVPVDPESYDPTATDMQRTSCFRLLDLALAERRRAEEKRVLYVAMTRARDRLVLSTRTPYSAGKEGSPTAVNSTWTALDWLRTLEPLAQAMRGTSEEPVRLATGTVEVRPPLAVDRPDLTPDRRLLDVIETLLADREVLAAVPPPTGRDQLDLFGVRRAARTTADAAILDPDALGRPAVLPVTALAELAVSPPRFYARVALGLDDADPEDGSTQFERVETRADAGVSRGAALGRLVHRRLASSRAGTAEVDAASPADAHVRAFTDSSRGREALAAARSHAEIAFVLPTAHGRLDGTIDRLYLAPDDVWTILDYKTDRIPPDATPLELAVRRGYDIQLLLYGAAGARILEIPDTVTIRLVLFFTHPALSGTREIVHEVTAGMLPSPARIDAVLRGVERALRESGGTAFRSPTEAREPFDFDPLTAWTRSS